MSNNQRGVTVYIDGEKVEDVAANPAADFNGDHIKPTIMWQKDGLSKAEHTLRIEIAAQGYITIDSFSYMPCEAEPEVEPLKVVSAYRINGNDNDLYVVFNKKVAAPAAGNDLVLALVANGWAGVPGGWDAANTAIARVAFPFAEAVSDQVFKFTRAGHVSWACDGGNINGEHPAVVAPVGGFWFWALLGNTTVTTADGAETLAQDYADVWNVYGKEPSQSWEFSVPGTLIAKTETGALTAVATPDDIVVPTPPEALPCEHEYSSVCDDTCDICGATRPVQDHSYDGCTDVDCNFCGAIREAGEHEYDNACDDCCNVCGEVRQIEDHKYDNACDIDCNECGAEREVDGHKYDNACDVDCNECGAEREVEGHKYDDEHDAECNECGAIRDVQQPDSPSTGDATLAALAIAAIASMGAVLVLNKKH